MVTDAIKRIRKLKPGTLQRHVDGQAKTAKDLNLTEDQWILNALATSDHAAGMVPRWQSLGLLDSEKAMPVFGAATVAVRKGGLTYNEGTGITTLPLGGIHKPKN